MFLILLDTFYNSEHVLYAFVSLIYYLDINHYLTKISLTNVEPKCIYTYNLTFC